MNQSRAIFSMLHHLLIGVTVACATNTANAATESVIRFVESKAPPLASGTLYDRAHIEVTGPITADGPARLRAALDVAMRKTDTRTLGGEPQVLVFLDSPGGSGQASLAMGRMLRAIGAVTWVPPHKSCSSACVFILAGGVDRATFDGAKLGIHRPTFDRAEFARLSQSEAKTRYERVSVEVQRFLKEMGIADDLFTRMMQVPSGQLRFIDEDFATKVNLLGVDASFAEWDRARGEQRYAPGFLDGIDRYVECINSGQSERQCSSLLPKSSQRRR